MDDADASAVPELVSPTVTKLVETMAEVDPGGMISMAMVGSSAHGRLRPDSDLDLLLLTRNPLSRPERQMIVDELLRVSGSRATVTPGRPIELTSLTLSDVVPWRYPATRDFLYGEWLRSDYESGRLPVPEPDPNLPVTITSARVHALQLFGPPVRDLLDPIPQDDLFRSLHDAVPALIDGLIGDERNVLLTLARMIVTLETGSIVPKDRAAAHVSPTLPPVQRQALVHAARGYLGDVVDDWDAHDAMATAQLLTRRISTHSVLVQESEEPRAEATGLFHWGG